jgi:hypothetical protein
MSVHLASGNTHERRRVHKTNITPTTGSSTTTSLSPWSFTWPNNMARPHGENTRTHTNDTNKLGARSSTYTHTHTHTPQRSGKVRTRLDRLDLLLGRLVSHCVYESMRQDSTRLGDEEALPTVNAGCEPTKRIQISTKFSTGKGALPHWERRFSQSPRRPRTAELFSA